jgi:hypothetical protein
MEQKVPNMRKKERKREKGERLYVEFGTIKHGWWW